MPRRNYKKNHDAEEFLRFILNDLQYHGTQTSDSLTCGSCKSTWTTKSDMNLILQIPMTNSIELSLQEILEPQLNKVIRNPNSTQIVGDCVKCGALGKTNKKYFRETKITDLPNLLILSLKRWYVTPRNTTEKHPARVEITQQLNINEIKYNLAGWMDIS